MFVASSKTKHSPLLSGSTKHCSLARPTICWKKLGLSNLASARHWAAACSAKTKLAPAPVDAHSAPIAANTASSRSNKTSSSGSGHGWKQASSSSVVRSKRGDRHVTRCSWRTTPLVPTDRALLVNINDATVEQVAGQMKIASVIPNNIISATRDERASKVQ